MHDVGSSMKGQVQKKSSSRRTLNDLRRKIQELEEQNSLYWQELEIAAVYGIVKQSGCYIRLCSEPGVLEQVLRYIFLS